jgi:hypothetical protein
MNISKERKIKDQRIWVTKRRALLWETKKNRLRITLITIKKLTGKSWKASTQISA